MKKVVILFSIAFLLLTACIIYLVRSGVSLRAAPLIRPSVISGDQSNIAPAIVLRMYEELKHVDYVVWGVANDDSTDSSIPTLIQREFERVFQKTVQRIDYAHTSSPQEIQACQTPCWLFLPREQANELGPNNFISANIKTLNQNYLTLTLVPFQRGIEIPSDCLDEKRLTLRCLEPLVVHESERKMKSDQRHFFLRRYAERDYFLFVENQKAN